MRLLGEHGAGERFILIQYSLPAILTSFHIAPATATLIGDGFALSRSRSPRWFAVRWRAQPRNVAALAIALLPLAVPFFHEHDFVIELIPAIVLAASADARVRLLAGIASVAILVDWLGVAQRPHLAPQTVCLALAVACAFAALPNRSLRAASPWPPLVTSLLLLSIAVPLALAFPAPVWPDTLGAFRAAPELERERRLGRRTTPLGSRRARLGVGPAARDPRCRLRAAGVRRLRGGSGLRADDDAARHAPKPEPASAICPDTDRRRIDRR